MAIVLSNGGKGNEATVIEKRLHMLTQMLADVQFEETERN